MIDNLKDCYFYFENAVPKEDDCLKIMCIKCHDKTKDSRGWFWQGSVKGYGPYDFICDTCGYAIHKHNQENTNE